MYKKYGAGVWNYYQFRIILISEAWMIYKCVSMFFVSGMYKSKVFKVPIYEKQIIKPAHFYHF